MGVTDKESTTTVVVTGDSYVEKDPYVVGDSSDVAITVTFDNLLYVASDASDVEIEVVFDLECSATVTDASDVEVEVTFGTATDPSTSTAAWASESKPSTGSWATESVPS